MNPKVDFYFNKAKTWQKEIEHLRMLVLEFKHNGITLNEELKWGCPCYTYNEKNIVLIHVFKEYCALLFFKGSLLKDPANLLIQQTANVQVPRQLRFTSALEIIEKKDIISAYILNAIEVENSGIKPELKKPSEFEMALEFKLQLESIPTLKMAFEKLTPGRQRAYLLHFSAPKQSATRSARVEKCIPQILSGKGLND